MEKNDKKKDLPGEEGQGISPAGLKTDETAGIDAVNILREKTFNEELRSLVVRVRKNETTESQVADLSGHEEELAREILVFKLHQLFYLCKNLQGYDAINPHYNPFDTYLPDEIMNDRDLLVEQIRGVMESSGYGRFFLLSYDLEKKGFTADILTYDRMPKEDIIISIRDSLYHLIHESPEGYILQSDEIRGNDFLSKILYPDGVSYETLYLITTEKISGLIEDKFKSISKEGGNIFQPPPILGIFLSKDDGNVAGEIFRAIINRLALPLHLYKKNLPDIFNINASISFNDLYSYLVLLLNYYLMEEDRICIIIKIRRYGDNFSFIIRYLITKLQNVLNSSSILLHFSEKRIVVLTDTGHERDVHGVIEKFNEIYDNNFKYKLISQSNRSVYSWEILKMLV